jgi:hypothetical protein
LNVTNVEMKMIKAEETQDGHNVNSSNVLTITVDVEKEKEKEKEIVENSSFGNFKSKIIFVILTVK